jgi:2-methylcitrate dehydratase PrpD
MALNGAELLTRGWHSGAVFGPLAAAAAAGRVWGLDAAQFEDALGLAATQAGGLMAAQFEAMSKRMHHGFAARSGVYAAALAAGGYTGIKRVFEQAYGGFLTVFGEGHSPQPDRVSEGLGEQWETERIAIKPYATMGGLLAAVDAVLALAAEGPLPADGIARIEVAVSEPVYHHGGWIAKRPLTPVGAQMNLAYAVAVAILDGAALVQQFAPARIDRDDVWELIARTEVAHDPEMDRMGRGTRLRIFMRDSSQREAVVRIPRGVLDNALSNLEILDKFRRLTKTILAPARREEIERLTLGLEEIADVRELTAVLAAPVRPALG